MLYDNWRSDARFKTVYYRPKPTCARMFGVWGCAGAFAFGSGTTPEAAYKDWQIDLRMQQQILGKAST